MIGLLIAAALAGCAGTETPSANSFSATYRCHGGQQIVAVYWPPDRARIMLSGNAIDMHISRSADGARYVGGNRVWWTKGSGPGSHGTLFERGKNDTAGEKITSCVQLGTSPAA